MSAARAANGELGSIGRSGRAAGGASRRRSGRGRRWSPSGRDDRWSRDRGEAACRSAAVRRDLRVTRRRLAARRCFPQARLRDRGAGDRSRRGGWSWWRARPGRQTSMKAGSAGVAGSVGSAVERVSGSTAVAFARRRYRLGRRIIGDVRRRSRLGRRQASRGGITVASLVPSTCCVSCCRHRGGGPGPAAPGGSPAISEPRRSPHRSSRAARSWRP